MSLLTLISNVAQEINQAVPTSVVNNNTRIVKQLLALLYRVADDARDQIVWPELIREHTFSLVSGTDSYALPADFERPISDTEWDRTDSWPLVGPLSPQEWQIRKSGITTAYPYPMFRTKGRTNNQMFIHPTPDSGNDGNTIAYEYISSTWILPAVWANSTVYAAGGYSSDDGTPYQTTLGGTSSGTGVDDDVGVTDWTALTSYPTFLADTDFMILEEDFLGLGVQWRFLRAKRLPYEDYMREWYGQLKRKAIKKKNSRKLPLGRSFRSRFISSYNVPDTGYGT